MLSLFQISRSSVFEILGKRLTDEKIFCRLSKWRVTAFCRQSAWLFLFKRIRDAWIFSDWCRRIQASCGINFVRKPLMRKTWLLCCDGLSPHHVIHFARHSVYIWNHDVDFVMEFAIFATTTTKLDYFAILYVGIQSAIRGKCRPTLSVKRQLRF
jgi:hypothetical protein